MKTRTPIAFFLIALFLVFAAPTWVDAAWQAEGLPLATGTSNQDLPLVIPDGTGGSIIFWEDDIFGYKKLFAQRLDRYGDKLWTVEGVEVSSRAANQRYPSAVADGNGGCLVFWDDNLGTYTQIYGQHLNAQGARLWGVQGQAVSAYDANQARSAAVGDGSGGAVVVWRDWRNDTGNGDVDLLALRLSGAGASLYPWGNRLVSTALTAEGKPFAVGDGTGGVFVCWATDENNQDNNNIFAQRLNAVGEVQWGSYGTTVCSSAGYQGLSVAALDGSGGLWVAWEDRRTSDTAIYMQRLASDGTAQWVANGVIISGSSESAISPNMMADNSGGAFVLFEARRVSGYGLFVRHIRNTGFMLFDDDKTIYSGSGFSWDGLLPIVADGRGGCYVVWPDSRTGTHRLYAQHVNAADQMTWPQNGIPVADFSCYQDYPSLAADGANGAVCAWRDGRAVGSDLDVYAQRLMASPPLSGPFLLLLDQ